MQRVNNILKNKTYEALLSEIEELETDRIFCRHNIDHFLDVARIATIINDDEDLGIQRDMIYAAALLHDIGRGEQYTKGIAHELSSAGIAPSILRECGYTDEETDVIVTAIREHGNEAVKDKKDLTGILYRADKASRKCYRCKAIDKCHKRFDKLVTEIKY